MGLYWKLTLWALFQSLSWFCISLRIRPCSLSDRLNNWTWWTRLVMSQYFSAYPALFVIGKTEQWTWFSTLLFIGETEQWTWWTSFAMDLYFSTCTALFFVWTTEHNELALPWVFISLRIRPCFLSDRLNNWTWWTCFAMGLYFSKLRFSVYLLSVRDFPLISSSLIGFLVTIFIHPFFMPTGSLFCKASRPPALRWGEYTYFQAATLRTAQIFFILRWLMYSKKFKTIDVLKHSSYCTWKMAHP